jgi:hypothetical protein
VCGWISFSLIFPFLGYADYILVYSLYLTYPLACPSYLKVEKWASMRL